MIDKRLHIGNLCFSIFWNNNLSKNCVREEVFFWIGFTHRNLKPMGRMGFFVFIQKGHYSFEFQKGF